jgi:hypothetical protein
MLGDGGRISCPWLRGALEEHPLKAAPGRILPAAKISDDHCGIQGSWHCYAKRTCKYKLNFFEQDVATLLPPTALLCQVESILWLVVWLSTPALQCCKVAV